MYTLRVEDQITISRKAKPYFVKIMKIFAHSKDEKIIEKLGMCFLRYK